MTPLQYVILEPGLIALEGLDLSGTWAHPICIRPTAYSLNADHLYTKGPQSTSDSPCQIQHVVSITGHANCSQPDMPDSHCPKDGLARSPGDQLAIYASITWYSKVAALVGAAQLVLTVHEGFIFVLK